MKKESTTVKSAYRVMYILEALSNNPIGLTFTDLNTKLELPKSSLNQLLNTLLEMNMIRYEAKIKTYTLGAKIWEFAMAYSNNLPVNQIVQPYLEKLRNDYDETVQMAVLDGADVVYMAKIPSSQPLQLSSQVGSRLPAYVTGIGKALLACLSTQQLLDIYPEPKLDAYTEKTITKRDRLLEELNEIRERGYARDLGEYSSEIRCVAAPILGFGNSPVAAISFSVWEEQELKEKEASLSRALSACTKELSLRLGATEPFPR
ncbi:IclR family transcriptional regulator [Tuberibacillus sp. Marseille-P3662]|uniref:IclR family transcriptional regulator n=1 Tax=Tuberibacillus sp. Marseille-P3662 TaxID=1965358 RepID=UPI000A1CCC67|nr:IclR family transcriptional regulator [Tuberibacillus sp. Marseille-P3662]